MFTVFANESKSCTSTLIWTCFTHTSVHK